MRTARESRNERAFSRAQAAWDAMYEQVTDEEPWEECEDCHGDTPAVYDCWRCLGHGGYAGARLVSFSDWRREQQEGQRNG